MALWLTFLVPVVVLVALEIGVFLRSGLEPTMKESVAWTLAWTTLAGLFGLALASKLGPGEGLGFFTAYVVEQALSVDNLFVFLVIFRELSVPVADRRRSLTWGILGAVVLRVALLAAGTAFLAKFHALGWMLGAFLVVMGVRGALELRHGEEESKLPPYLGGFAIAAILVADLVFAVDSIPAVLGVSTTPIVVITSNVFAVLGMRSMYFVVQGLISRLKYLPHGLAAVLVVVGAKMLVGPLVTIPTWLSLVSVLAVLGASVLASLSTTKEKVHAE